MSDLAGAAHRAFFYGYATVDLHRLLHDFALAIGVALAGAAVLWLAPKPAALDPAVARVP